MLAAIAGRLRGRARYGGLDDRRPADRLHRSLRRPRRTRRRRQRNDRGIFQHHFFPATVRATAAGLAATRFAAICFGASAFCTTVGIAAPSGPATASFAAIAATAVRQAIQHAEERGAALEPCVGERAAAALAGPVAALIARLGPRRVFDVGAPVAFTATLTAVLQAHALIQRLMATGFQNRQHDEEATNRDATHDETPEAQNRRDARSGVATGKHRPTRPAKSRNSPQPTKFHAGGASNGSRKFFNKHPRKSAWRPYHSKRKVRAKARPSMAAAVCVPAWIWARPLRPVRSRPSGSSSGWTRT